MTLPHDTKLELLREIKKDAESIYAEIPDAISATHECDDESFAASLHALWWRINTLQQRVDRLIKGE